VAVIASRLSPRSGGEWASERETLLQAIAQLRAQAAAHLDAIDVVAAAVARLRWGRRG